jgi:DNA polymerase III subunit epsilon
VETANRHRGSICAVGLAVVEGGMIVRKENWLCRPPDAFDWFDGFNMFLHGITPEAVAGRSAMVA